MFVYGCLSFVLYLLNTTSQLLFVKDNEKIFCLPFSLDNPEVYVSESCLFQLSVDWCPRMPAMGHRSHSRDDCPDHSNVQNNSLILLIHFQNMFQLWHDSLSCRKNLWQACKSSFLSASISKLSNPLKCSSCHFLTISLREGLLLKKRKEERRVSIWFSPFSQALVLSSPWWWAFLWKVFAISSVACQVTALGDLQLTAQQLSVRKKQEGNQVSTFTFLWLYWMLQMTIFLTGKLTFPYLQTLFHSYPTHR